MSMRKQIRNGETNVDAIVETCLQPCRSCWRNSTATSELVLGDARASPSNRLVLELQAELAPVFEAVVVLEPVSVQLKSAFSLGVARSLVVLVAFVAEAMATMAKVEVVQVVC